MTAYRANPLDRPIPALYPGSIGYSFGNQDVHAPTARLQITSVAITTNVATVGVVVLEGNIPAVGSLISIRGTVTVTSGGAPNFNVTNVAITAVSINTITGAGTISFALTSSDIATAPDTGRAAVPIPIVLETLPSSATAGLQFGMSSNSGGNKQRGIAWFTKVTGTPATIFAELQCAVVDEDAEYATFDSSSNVGGESRSLANVNPNFVRVKFTSTGGTSPKCAAGIAVL